MIASHRKARQLTRHVGLACCDALRGTLRRCAVARSVSHVSDPSADR